MRKELRLKSFDNYLLALMSSLMLMSLYMLYGVKSSPEDNSNKVASIVEQLKTVKRKSSLYQGWLDVKSGDNLSPNDEIYTHGQSSAKIRFINGPEISLFENSLLRIKTQDSKNTFALDKGNLIAKLDKNAPSLDIEISGKKYTFKSDNANIQVEQNDKENKFMLLDGKARMADQEILPNQVVIQDIKTGTLKIKQIPFSAKNPLNGFKKYYVSETSVNFNWENLKVEGEVSLFIFKDSALTELSKTEIVTGKNNHSFSFNEAGTYYWKLVTQDGVSSPLRSFTLIEERPLDLDVNRDILYRSPKMTDKVLLKWQKDEAKNFLIKIESPDGKIDEVRVSKNSYEFSPSLIGDYQMSARVNETARPEALWSFPVTISLRPAESITINSLTPPLIEKVVYKNQMHNNLLSWSGPNSIKYKIILTKNGKTTRFETEHTSYPLNLKDAGDYSWEIQGETLSGVSSNVISGKIILKYPLKISQLPAEGAVIELEKPDQLVAFKWDQVKNSKNYQFEISDDPAFKNIIVDKTVDTNTATTSLAQIGKYFWRVKVKNGESVEYSDPVSVEIRPSPPLATPETAPVKIKLKYLDDKTSSFRLMDFFISSAYANDPIAVAEWDLPSNPRAKSYVVEIYKDNNLANLLLKIETDKPHVTWKNALPGVFYWRVSYIDHWGRQTDFSKLSTLETELTAKPVVEIVMISPAHKSELKLEDNENFKLKWDLIPENKIYTVLVAEDLDFEKIVLTKKVSENELILDCTGLKTKNGTFYWKVTAGENTSKRRSFQVTCPEEKKIVATEKAPEPEVTQTQVLPKEEVKKIYTLPDHFGAIGVFPHQVSYQNKSTQYTAKIDGIALNSWYAHYQRPVDLGYFTIGATDLWVSRGKVFSNITFTDFNFNLKLHRLEASFQWGPVLSFAKKTLYVEKNLSITDEGLSAPMGGLFIQKNIERLKMNAEVKFGGLLSLNGSLQYLFKDQYSAGAFVESTSLTKDNNKHTSQTFGLLFNYTFDFRKNE